MKKFIAMLLAMVMCVSMAACGGASTPSAVYETETLKIDGLCVDDSYQDEDGTPLKLLYMFYTVNAKDTNCEVDSQFTNMTIGEANEYSSEHFSSIAKATEYTSSYYSSSTIKDLYVGESQKIVTVFKVPEGDLVEGKAITFNDDQVPDMEKIRMTTDDIQHFSSPEAIAEAMDPDGYAAEMHARENADEATANTVRSYLNGYQWTFYVNFTTYELEFWEPNNFQLRTSLGTSSDGTYTVKNGYIFCTYPNGNTVEIPYTLENGDINLDTIAGFSVYE